jgi:hypothetical protein
MNAAGVGRRDIIKSYGIRSVELCTCQCCFMLLYGTTCWSGGNGAVQFDLDNTKSCPDIKSCHFDRDNDLHPFAKRREFTIISV